MFKLGKFLPVIVGLILGMSAFVVHFGKQNDEYAMYKTQKVQIGDVIYKSYVVDTPELREQGLSGKKSLPEGSAMLFIFENSGQYGFWMKDMSFPIDILWLDGDKKIIFIKENALLESYPEIFSPESPALYVLELPAGEVTRSSLELGEKVKFLP